MASACMPEEFFEAVHLPPEQPAGPKGGRPRIGHRVVIRVRAMPATRPGGCVDRILRHGLACRPAGMLGEEVGSHTDRADHREGGDPLEQAVAMVQELLVGRPFVPCHDQDPLD